MAESQKSFYLHTLGCPKNQVDSDKIAGTLIGDGLVSVEDPSSADLVVVNTCAFIEEAREESVGVVLEIDQQRRPDSKIVVTGCMAERYGSELSNALPEVDLVAGFGVPVNLTKKSSGLEIVADEAVPRVDLLNLQRPASALRWA